MEYTSVLAVWAVVVAGPCVISWLAGDLVGSSRTRKLYDDNEQSGDGTVHAGAGAGAFRVQEWRVSGAVHPLVGACYDGAAQPTREPTIEEKAAGAQQRQERRARLANIPPPSPERSPDFVTQAAPVIPATPLGPSFVICDEERILRRYEASVERLHRSNPVAAHHARRAGELDQTIRLTLADPVVMPKSAQDTYRKRA